mgnify:CR=1 FL=1|tara:strand:- start:373 stop:1755 length:1383 start_codon:yes stop_codon:yes gene_type:complete
MKYTKSHQNKWSRFKKDVIKKKKKLHLFTKWTFQLDKNTLGGNIRVSYSIPYQIEVEGEIIERNKQQKLYLKNRTFNDLVLLTTDKEILSVDDRVNQLREEATKLLRSDDEGSIEFWIDRYITRDKNELKDISPTTIASDTYTLNDLINWIKKHKPKRTSIYHLDKKLLEVYFNYRVKIGGVFDERYGKRKKWSGGGVRTSYGRIRAFYNWMANKSDLGLEHGKLNRMELPKKEIHTESFSPSEIKRVWEFMKKQKKSREWGWFIPILRVLLLTGCRCSEVSKMMIDDIDIDNREWYFKGKGNKKRKTILQDNELWKEIQKQIYDEDGKPYDKKYVFHLEFWRQGFKGIGGYKKHSKGHHGTYECGFKIVDYNTNFSPSGIYQKFKKMVNHLELNKKLSPHSCRRFFITEMLKNTNGNIPLVAQLVGHSTWDVVRMYSKSVITEDTKTNLNLKQIVSKIK